MGFLCGRRVEVFVTVVFTIVVPKSWIFAGRGRRMNDTWKHEKVRKQTDSL